MHVTRITMAAYGIECVCPGPLKGGCLYQGTREEVEEHQKECSHLEAGEKRSLQELTQEVCGYVDQLLEWLL